MKPEELKSIADAIRESAEGRRETSQSVHSSMRGFTKELQSSRKLWHKGSRSILIKAGLALIAFPDPTISDAIGVGMVAAGLIHDRIQDSALHIEDVYKTFPQVLKELNSVRNRIK